MKVYLRSDPWKSLNGIEPVSYGSPKVWDVDGRGSPQVAIPIIKGNKPRLAGLFLPACGFPFKHNDIFYQNYHLPTASVPGRLRQDVDGDLYVNGSTFSIRQSDLLGRPQHNERDHKIVSKRNEWMQWQIQRYMELADPTVLDKKKFESVFQSKHVRRSWETVRSEWMRDEENGSRISLIVKLAADEVLLNALDRITANPRRILERYRQDTPIGRIQELDAACLRDYARRPGRVLEEKAGTKQALLAVRRRERIDTLENKVTRWTIHRMKNLALEWLRQHEKYTGDSNERVQKVKKLSMSLRDWELRDSFMNDVPMLSRHPSGPNYPLQFEQRYAKVWIAYVKIRQEMKVYEDAWTWQRAMWPETGRQIFHSVLTEAEEWSEQGTSTPIYRPEGLSGDWLLPFRSPGPFETPNGPALLFDSLDLHGSGLGEYWMEIEQFESAHSIGKCGCEQALWFPEKNKGIAIWYAMIEPRRISWEKITQDTRQALRNTLNNNSLDQNWIGLVLAALTPDESHYSEEADIAHQERDSIGVLIPMEVHRHARDVKAGIELAIEALGKIV